MPRLRRLPLPGSRGHAVLLAVLLCLLAPLAVRAQDGPEAALPLTEYRAALQTAHTALTANPCTTSSGQQAITSYYVTFRRVG